MDIRQITAAQTWELRRSVMWPDKDLEYVKISDDEDGLHYGGFIGEELISVISLFYQGEQAQFRKFATKACEQGKGYGTALLQYVLSSARQRGIQRIWCHARTEKIRFYEGFGFETAGVPFMKEGKEFIVMAKEFLIA